VDFVFEIADKDEIGGGELVYTTLTRDVMPLIRYRSTDVTHLIDEPCACGFFTKRIAKIRARTDEMVVCGMGNVGPWVFAEILRGVNGSAPEWQALVKHVHGRDIVELQVETNSPTQQTELQTIVLDHLKERFPDFWKNYEMKLYDFNLKTSPPGTLRTGRKLRRVVDQRLMTASTQRNP